MEFCPEYTDGWGRPSPVYPQLSAVNTKSEYFQILEDNVLEHW